MESQELIYPTFTHLLHNEKYSPFASNQKALKGESLHGGVQMLFV